MIDAQFFDEHGDPLELPEGYTVELSPYNPRLYHAMYKGEVVGIYVKEEDEEDHQA